MAAIQDGQQYDSWWKMATSTWTRNVKFLQVFWILVKSYFMVKSNLLWIYFLLYLKKNLNFYGQKIFKPIY